VRAAERGYFIVFGVYFIVMLVGIVAVEYTLIGYVEQDTV
jgi:hypothetical protein